MHCHLVIPHLFWPASADDPGAPSPWQDLHLPFVERLLARARLEVTEHAPLHVWAASQFGLDPETLALAPWRLRGEGLDPGEATWVCLDPLHLQAGARQLMRSANPLSSLTPIEAEQIVATLNAHLAHDGIEIVAPHPYRWYARCASADFRAAAPPIAGDALAETGLPQGPDGARWRRLLTEVQMILHSHPVNEAREARNASVLNALWAWGVGRACPLPARKPEQWISDDPILRGLALGSAAQVAPTRPGAAAEAAVAGAASSASAMPASLESSIRVQWLHDDGPARAVEAGDAGAWRSALAALDAGAVKQRLEALRSGAIGMLTLHAIGPAESLKAELTRHDLRRFWRRLRPLKTYLAAHEADSR